MEKQNISVGLDIGTTKIVAMIGRKNEYGKVEILGIGKSKSLGVHRGVVNNITQTIQSIQQAVQEAEAAASEKLKMLPLVLQVSIFEVYNIVIISRDQILIWLLMKRI